MKSKRKDFGIAKLLFLILAVYCFLKSLLVFLTGEFTWKAGHEFYFDGTPRYAVSSLLLALGVGLLFVMVKYKSKKQNFYICTNCDFCSQVQAVSPAHVCPECQGAMEPLEGFYERHPEINQTLS